MKTLLFGGSFNPPHMGHLILADEAMKEFAYDRVLFVPAWKPPHKEIHSDPGPETRLEMLRSACEGQDGFEVEDCEIRRAGISYSIDTVRYLVAVGKLEAGPGFLFGADLAEDFGAWKEADALARECRLILMRRDDEEISNFPWPHLELRNFDLPLSSSLVRSRIASGGAWKYLVPPGVRRIIENRGLYGYR